MLDRTFRTRGLLAACLLLALSAAAPVAAQDDAPAEPPKAAAAAPLPKGLGEAPPRLTDVEWVAGKAVKTFSRGTAYVVLFFSASDPSAGRALRLAESLQASAERVSAVAIAALDRKGAMTNLAWLERNKARFKLTLAHDKLDKTVKAWDAQFALKGTPRALLVDRNGRVAWSGNPFNGLAEALAAVVAGEKGGPERVLAERRARAEEFGPLAEEHKRASGRENPAPKLLEVVEGMLALDREFARPYLPGLYAALVKAGMQDEAAAWGKRLVDELLADDEVALNDLAWTIVDPKAADGPRDLAVAKAAAERANELAGGLDAAILDTLARVTWRDGRREEAIVLQERALQAASWNADLKKELQATLDEYRSGLGS